MFSIHSTAYNLTRIGFPWKDAYTNWLSFLANSGEIVIAVNTSEDDTARLLREFFAKYRLDHPWCQTRIEVVEAAIPYTDPEFDGKLKALALSHCTQPYAILLDCDEVFPLSAREHWQRAARFLDQNRQLDGLLIPSVDLFHDEHNYKSIGQKWYLHRNLPGITRGVVKWAYREDGTIDITKSDTCEAIYADSRELIRAAPITQSNLPQFMQMSSLENGDVPFIFHLGWLNKEQRIKQSEFWAGVWNARNGSDVERAKTLAELEKIQYYRHRLPGWKTIS